VSVEICGAVRDALSWATLVRDQRPRHLAAICCDGSDRCSTWRGGSVAAWPRRPRSSPVEVDYGGKDDAGAGPVLMAAVEGLLLG